MAAYTLLPDGMVVRTSDGALIPTDPANRDRLAVVAWLAAGNVADVPPAAPVPVPQSISRRQFLLALLGAGFVTPAEALAAATEGAVPANLATMLATLPEADALAVRITWASMTVAERDNPIIATLIAAGLASEAQTDELFRIGAGL